MVDSHVSPAKGVPSHAPCARLTRLAPHELPNSATEQERLQCGPPKYHSCHSSWSYVHYLSGRAWQFQDFKLVVDSGSSSNGFGQHLVFDPCWPFIAHFSGTFWTCAGPVREVQYTYLWVASISALYLDSAAPAVFDAFWYSAEKGVLPHVHWPFAAPKWLLRSLHLKKFAGNRPFGLPCEMCRHFFAQAGLTRVSNQTRTTWRFERALSKTDKSITNDCDVIFRSAQVTCHSEVHAKSLASTGKLSIVAATWFLD